MTGFDSKRQMAQDKFSDPWLEIAEWVEQGPEPEPRGDPLYEPLAVEKQDDYSSIETGARLHSCNKQEFGILVSSGKQFE